MSMVNHVDSAPVVDVNNWLVSSENLWDGETHYETKSLGGLTFARCSDGRFAQDRCMEHVQNLFVLLDGVLLNKKELFEEYGEGDIAGLIATMYTRLGCKEMLRSLRGPFEGCIYDTEKNKLYVFGNHTGDTAAYVYFENRELVASNSFDLIQRVLKRKNIETSFDERAARMMLTFGFMTDDSTFAEEVKRVLPGHYLQIDLETGEAKKPVEYWRLRYNPDTSLTLEQSADLMQEIFMNATRRVFDKDLEYGYEDHLVDISGGMDSRVVNLAGKKLGHDRMTNITYSETGTQEAAASIAASAMLGNDLLYYPLDTARSVMDPELNLRLNSGSSLYSGITGGRAVLERLNFARHGLEHTGQAGDAVFVSYAESEQELPAHEDVGKYSLLHDYSDLVDTAQFQNEEIMGMLIRGFLGTNSSHLLRRHYTYAVSPFLDVDLLEAAFTIPLNQRFGHRVYEEWVRKYHPEALTVPTTRKLASEQQEVARKANRSTISRYWNWGLFRLRRDFYKLVRAPEPEKLATHQLRPGHWYDTDEDFRQMLDGKERAVENLEVSPSLKADLSKSFQAPRAGDSIIDKTLAATVVTMHQLYFS